MTISVDVHRGPERGRVVKKEFWGWAFDSSGHKHDSGDLPTNSEAKRITRELLRHAFCPARGRPKFYGGFISARPSTTETVLVSSIVEAGAFTVYKNASLSVLRWAEMQHKGRNNNCWLTSRGLKAIQKKIRGLSMCVKKARKARKRTKKRGTGHNEEQSPEADSDSIDYFLSAGEEDEEEEEEEENANSEEEDVNRSSSQGAESDSDLDLQEFWADRQAPGGRHISASPLRKRHAKHQRVVDSGARGRRHGGVPPEHAAPYFMVAPMMVVEPAHRQAQDLPSGPLPPPSPELMMPVQDAFWAAAPDDAVAVAAGEANELAAAIATAGEKATAARVAIASSAAAERILIAAQQELQAAQAAQEAAQAQMTARHQANRVQLPPGNGSLASSAQVPTFRARIVGPRMKASECAGASAQDSAFSMAAKACLGNPNTNSPRKATAVYSLLLVLREHNLVRTPYRNHLRYPLWRAFVGAAVRTWRVHGIDAAPTADAGVNATPVDEKSPDFVSIVRALNRIKAKGGLRKGKLVESTWIPQVQAYIERAGVTISTSSRRASASSFCNSASSSSSTSSMPLLVCPNCGGSAESNDGTCRKGRYIYRRYKCTECMRIFAVPTSSLAASSSSFSPSLAARPDTRRLKRQRASADERASFAGPIRKSVRTSSRGTMHRAREKPCSKPGSFPYSFPAAK